MKKIQDSSNFDMIRQYVAGDEKIVLTELQQKLLKRWNFYISLKLAGELTTSAIVKMVMEEFDVERATVFNDMGSAEALFGYSSTMNKRFRIGARIDFLEEKIKVMYDAKEYDIAAKLESVLQKYYDSYPELKHERAPRVINFNMTKNDFNLNGLPSVEDAITILKTALPTG